MRKVPLILLLCGLYIAPAGAQSNEDNAQAATDDNTQSGEEASEPTLAELASGADFIGIAKVDTTEYETVRELPSEGFAILNVLVAYRHPGEVREAPGSIDVYEEGFGKDACYYPERQNEGRRYLVFLKERTGNDEDGEEKTGFKGMKPGCMLPVLITDDNRFALRFPVPDVEIRDRSVIRKMDFADPDAFITAGQTLSYTRVDYMFENGWLRQADDDRHVFTTGIYLRDARRLMNLEEDTAADDQSESDDASAGAG